MSQLGHLTSSWVIDIVATRPRGDPPRSTLREPLFPPALGILLYMLAISTLCPHLDTIQRLAVIQRPLPHPLAFLQPLEPMQLLKILGLRDQLLEILADIGPPLWIQHRGLLLSS